MAKVECPECGLEGEADRFCGNCGRRLPGPAAAAGAVVLPPVSIPDGMPFGASVSFAETMWAHVASPVRVRFRAARDIYSDVSVSILNGKDELARRSHGCRPFRDETTFSFNLPPRMPGAAIELTARFECVRDGSDDPDVFEGPFSVCVLEENSHHISIDASTIVSGAGASVVQYKNDIGGGIVFSDRRFAPTGTVTQPLELSLAATPRRLTLAREGGAIHLWALLPDETVVCGRSDDCGYVLRVFDKDGGGADDERSNVISRRHFRLAVAGGRTLRVADGADEGAPSSCGTSIGEMEISPRGVPLGEGAYSIDLGTRYTRRGVLSLAVEVTVNDDGSLAGFSIGRDDGLDERVVAIASRTVPFGGGRFSWDGRRFLFDGVKIVPGVSVEVDGNAYEVRTYRQRKK